MYPSFLEKTKAEKHGAATRSFYWANEVEKVHGALYEDVIKTLERGDSVSERDYYVCRECGYTIADARPDKCPVCAAKREAFFKVD